MPQVSIQAVVCVMRAMASYREGVKCVGRLLVSTCNDFEHVGIGLEGGRELWTRMEQTVDRVREVERRCDDLIVRLEHELRVVSAYEVMNCSVEGLDAAQRLQRSRRAGHDGVSLSHLLGMSHEVEADYRACMERIRTERDCDEQTAESVLRRELYAAGDAANVVSDMFGSLTETRVSNGWVDEEFIEANELMLAHFGESIPSRRLPATVTKREVIQAVHQSVEAGKNLLPELPGYPDVPQGSYV